jgi:arylsulfatase A-like enzyme
MRNRRFRIFAALMASAGALALVPAEAASNGDFPAVFETRPVILEERQAPADAPNVLIVLMDDVGFGADSTFGGAVPTPNLDAVAAQGLRYNRFHTTAMCSPTRAALLTGRNHHRVEMGNIVNVANGEPGYTTRMPKSAATIGRVLQLNGYSTAWFGKNHVTPNWEQTAAGPFDRWPNGLGFDYFYGFMDGASDQFAPILIENRTAIDPAQDDDYILDRDLADHTIDWVDRQGAAASDKPFLVYLAPGTAHEPHQAPREWLEKFRGRFDDGWDVERERIFARQKEMGIIPQDAALAPRPELLRAWDDLSSEEQRVSARLMEAFAAQRAFFDYQFGRIVEALKERGEWDNTLVFFIDGDNGSSPEGGLNGRILPPLNLQPAPLDYDLENLDRIGGPFGGGNYSASWGFALDTPFPWFKQVASHLGGQRAGMVVSWPERIEGGGEVRSQYGHVNDIAPTIYEAIGITPPEVVDGVKQMPFDGTSLVYSFAAADAPSRHNVQYYEMLTNIGIYKNGWLASRVPPKIRINPDYVAPPQHWELFNLEEDFSQTFDVAAQHPDQLAELQREFYRQAEQNGFTLLEAGAPQRSDPALRPDPFAGPRTLTFRRGGGPIIDNAFPAINNRAWSLVVDVTVSGDGAEGTIISQGGLPYGWGLYIIEGRPTFIYVNEPQEALRLAVAEPLAAGTHRLSVSMTPLDDQPGGPATVTLRVDEQEPLSQRLARTVRVSWGSNGVGIGREVGMVMLPEMKRPFAFTGKMGLVTFTLK